MTNIAFGDVTRIISAKDNGGETSVVIVDVRTAEEVNNTGLIPHAINIPVNIVRDVLVDSDPKEFESIFEMPKPDPKKNSLLIYCHAGVRSLAASDVCEDAGFKVLHYPEGFAGWMKRQQ
eukprot:GDKK01013384.1.p1 GENE.GDKK01013384.1~~GDKK01013384.1.p1  ORF type:complete len:130 (-),score=18.62 GDKK01013384.1:55-414(-)